MKMMSKFGWMHLRTAALLLLWLAGLALWHAIVVFFEFPKYLVSGPIDVLVALRDDASLIFSHALVTSQEWAIGLLISIVFGICLAFVCFSSRAIRFVIHPFLVISQSIPYLVFAPVLMLWFELGMKPIIVLVVLTCSFPIAFVLLDGLERIRDEYNVVIGLLRLNRLRAWRHIYAPASLPYFFSGLKISVTYAYVSAVMSELIGSDAGLGVYITRAQNSYRIDKVMAAVFVVVILSLVSTAVVGLIRDRIVFWKAEKK